MAYRQIHTQMWKDDWFLELTPAEKLLFIYLFSNDNTNILGLYRINLRVIEFETGQDRNAIQTTLDKFERDGKVIYQDGYIWVINLLRYNFNRSDRTYKAVVNALHDIPDIPLKIRYIEAANRVLIRYGYSIDGPTSAAVTVTESVAAAGQTDAAGGAEVEPGVELLRKNAYRAYTKGIGIITPAVSDKIDLALMDYPAGWVDAAIREAELNNARSWNYCEAILKRWKVDGFKVNGKGRAPEPSGKPYIPEEHASEVY